MAYRSWTATRTRATTCRAAESRSLRPKHLDGGAARAEYLGSLATRLGAESVQYKCAVKRLDEAIAHARKLKSEGKVYTAEQWESHDIQKAVAKVALKKAKNHPDHAPGLLQTPISPCVQDGILT